MAIVFQVLFAALVMAACTAEPVQFRGNGRTNRFFARQEATPSSSPAPVSAPYPPAGVTPSIVFELPTEQTTVQPDNTYLPPAAELTPDNTYGPPEQTYGPPDNTYGPPAAAEPADQPPTDPQAERIIFVQRNNRAPAKLVQLRRRLQPLRAARLQLEPIEIVRSQPVIAYSVQYKSF